MKKDGFIKDFTISNDSISLTVLNYGATIQSLMFNGKEMVLGYNEFDDYIKYNDYFGAIVGRYANRISNGEFNFNGKNYRLDKNDGQNTLHGGKNGFSKVYWEAVVENNSIEMKYFSKDGESGFPGNLYVSVKYVLDKDTLKILYSAVSDVDTVVSLTNHAYFNLTGGNRSIENHSMLLNANEYTPIDESLIPTGELKNVSGTFFDFRTKKNIGQDIDKDDMQLKIAGGYDHNFVVNGKGFRKVAEVDSCESNIRLECFSDMPGVQFYSGNFLKERKIKDGLTIDKRYGFCLEPQYFPDSINKINFETGVLKTGERFESRTDYKFTKINR